MSKVPLAKCIRLPTKAYKDSPTFDESQTFQLFCVAKVNENEKKNESDMSNVCSGDLFRYNFLTSLLHWKALKAEGFSSKKIRVKTSFLCPKCAFMGIIMDVALNS